jgi:hypothetical protein
MCPPLRIVSCRLSDCPTSRKRNDAYGHVLGLCRLGANMVFVGVPRTLEAGLCRWARVMAVLCS